MKNVFTEINDLCEKAYELIDNGEYYQDPIKIAMGLDNILVIKNIVNEKMEKEKDEVK